VPRRESPNSFLLGVSSTEGPLWHSHNQLAARKRGSNDLAILKSKVETLTEIIAALEHLALRIFFIAELFLLLFRHR
jgi:hypothetical protein